MRQLELAMTVGAAMLESGRHLIDPLRAGHGLELQVEETTNATHKNPVTSGE
jgi:hypothetical protein